jgi:hypothetical protein
LMEIEMKICVRLIMSSEVMRPTHGDINEYLSAQCWYMH